MFLFKKNGETLGQLETTPEEHEVLMQAGRAFPDIFTFWWSLPEKHVVSCFS